MKKLLAILAFALTTTTAFACGKPQGFLGQIWEEIDTSRLTGEEVFVRFDGTLDDLNKVIISGEKLTRTPGGQTREPVFGTLHQAMKNLETETQFLVGIDLKPGFRYGFAVKAFDRQGRELNSSAAFRCLNSPSIFSEKK